MTSYNINACSAYFQLLNGLTAGDAATDIRAVRLIFGDDTPVGISLTPAPSPNGEGSIYTLDGRKVDGVGAGPVPARLRKGMYIRDGRKVVVK
jgi:hypothetical protein